METGTSITTDKTVQIKKKVYLMRISDGLGSKYHLKFNENKLLLIQVDLSKVVNIVFNET